MSAPIVALVLAAASPARGEAPASPPSEAKPDTVRLGRVYLRVDAIDETALREAIALRVPRIPLSTFAGTVETTADGSLAALVEVRPVPEEAGAFAVTIITSDGRAYDRRISVDEDEDRSRVVAGAVASVLLGIEAGTVTPDRGDVPLPVAAPCPECPACPERASVPAPVSGTEPVPVQPGPAWADLGIRVSAPMVLAFGPAEHVDRFAAWSGEIAPGIRWRRGAFLGFSVRVGGRRVEDVGLLRTRFGLGAGYVLRRERFELEASGWLFVEPWWVRRDGSSAPFDPAAGTDRSPLVGGAVRLAPGIPWAPQGGHARFRFGAFAQVSGSAMPARDGRVPRIIVPTTGEPTRAFALGGVEGSFGFELATWFALERTPR